MSSSIEWARRCGASIRCVASALLIVSTLVSAVPAQAQVVPVDSAGGAVAPAGAIVTPESAPGLPAFLTVGMGYGQRFDPCAQCVSPENVQSFTVHVSVGKYLIDGLGIGVDASAWRRGHPGLPLGADSLSAGTPTTLVNQLGNASLVLSFETWHVFVRGGVGVAMGQQDIQDGQGDISAARGIGVGYTLGGGATLPIASMVSLAFFANWNVGSYDLSTPTSVVERGVRHEFVELGFGLTLR